MMGQAFPLQVIIVYSPHFDVSLFRAGDCKGFRWVNCQTEGSTRMGRKRDLWAIRVKELTDEDLAVPVTASGKKCSVFAVYKHRLIKILWGWINQIRICLNISLFWILFTFNLKYIDFLHRCGLKCKWKRGVRFIEVGLQNIGANTTFTCNANYLFRINVFHVNDLSIFCLSNWTIGS